MSSLSFNADNAATQFAARFLEAVDFQDAVEVVSGTRLDSLPEWDSLAALGVILMCDTEYSVTITGNDLKASTTVGDIYAAVLAKKGR
jgi:acyl carrier protein